MKTIGSGSTKQIEFENGQIDYMRVTSAEDLKKYKEASDKYNLYSVSEARLNYIQLNQMVRLCPHYPMMQEKQFSWH